MTEADQIAKLTAEVARLRADVERLSSARIFGAREFLASLERENARMRAAGLTYNAIFSVVAQYENAEISAGKLVELVRAAARCLAEDRLNVETTP